MIIPIRCFTCGKPIAKDWEEYNERVSSEENPMNVLDALGHERYCCRRMFLGQVEGMEAIKKYRRV